VIRQSGRERAAKDTHAANRHQSYQHVRPPNGLRARFAALVMRPSS